MTTLSALAHHALALVPESVNVPIFTGPARGLWWTPASSPVTAYWRGTYERGEVERFAATLRPGMVVYDVGAHAGYYSLVAARHVGTRGHVYAFEPVRASFRALKRHIECNGLTSIVTPFEGAVADVPGFLPFRDKPGVMESMLDPAGGRLVPTFVLDDLVARRSIQPPDVVKFDAEQAEVLVLRGAAKTIQRYRPVIFLSVHKPHTRAESIAMLHEWNYIVRSLNALSDEESYELLALPN